MTPKRTAAGHPRRHRDKLFNADIYALFDIKLIHQKPGGLVGQIVLIVRQIVEIRLNPDSRLFPSHKVNPVVNPYCLHNHPDFVITVLSSSHYVKAQVHLSVSFQSQMLYHRPPSQLRLYLAAEFCIFVFFCIQYIIYSVHIKYKNQLSKSPLQSVRIPAFLPVFWKPYCPLWPAVSHRFCPLPFPAG